jgi:hypothetical protein
MLTSSTPYSALHFAEIRHKILPNHQKFGVFLMHSFRFFRKNAKAFVVTNVEKQRKSKKVDFFLSTFFF